MRLRHRRAIGKAVLALVGASLGILAGFALGRAILLREASKSLSNYSFSLSRSTDELSQEVTAIFRNFNTSPFDFCSDQEIVALRSVTFRSRSLKDIGRTHNGLLVCSAFLGRLAQPHTEGRPSLILPGGTRVYSDVAVVMAASQKDRATVLESGQVDIVVSPDAFDHWDRPHVRYMIAIVDPTEKAFARVAGSSLEIAPAALRAQGLHTDSGILYSSRCSTSYPICSVTAENLSDIWGSSRIDLAVYMVLGGLVGVSVGFAGGLLYLRSRGLRQQLRQAIRRDSPSLRLVYQPILDVQSGRCVSAEALLRWHDEDGVAISPDVFIRLAEDTGFIGEVTEFVLARAIAEMAATLRQSPSLSLCVNVAPSDFLGAELRTVLDKHVRTAGIQPGQIVLELTERSTADLDSIRNAIYLLAREGYRVHMDDFGTGFSSLAYLNQLDVHAIKVDKSFTRTIGTDAVTAGILPQILAMAESLQLRVVVEGVETPEQVRFLESTRTSLQAQGWYYSHPMSAEEFRSFLQTNLAPVENQARLRSAVPCTS